MAWLAALIKAILEWMTGEVKKDTKAGDADAIPQSLKDRWRDRINRQLEKQKDEKLAEIKQIELEQHNIELQNNVNQIIIFVEKILYIAKLK